MSVVVETTIGDLTIDLFTDERPKTCMNFLKLCKMKYYNLNLLFSVERNFIAQTGDPTSNGRGGGSVFQNMYGEQAKFYEGEKLPIMKHSKLGTVSMVSCGSHLFGSQFFITLGENLDSLDGEHLVFGQVVEGLEVISKLNQTLTDNNNRPYQDIRISHTVILNDPYPDPDSLDYPDESPKPTRDMLESDYIAADENIDDTEGKSLDEIQEEIAEREAKARATILEMVGDLPDSDMAPPENVLFICKLNPVTTSDDLEIIFSRFGKINSCEVIRDRVTDNSLQYAFIEFAEAKSCEDAYFKMDNVLIDDRRIHVDFSQSVSKIKWRGKGRGVEFFDDSGRKVDNRRGQMYDPSKEYDRQNDRNRNYQGRGGRGKDFRSSNGGPRQYHRGNNKPWGDRDRRFQQWGRNGGLNRNYRENRDRERYEGGRPFVQEEREERNDRFNRRYDGRRNDRDEERSNKSKGKHESRRDGRHDEGRKSESDSRYFDEKAERYGDKHDHKRGEKDSRNDEQSERNAENRRLEKDDRFEGESNQSRSATELQEGGAPAREDGHKRKHSESDKSDDLPSDSEAREKLLKHLKKSLKKKKKKQKKFDSASDSEGEEEEKDKKKRRKKKKKKKISSDSGDSGSDVEVKKKNKKSKKNKKKDSDVSDSESDSKKKKKNKKKKKKKKKGAGTSDSSD